MWCRWCSLGTAGIVLSGVLSILAGFCFNANLEVQKLSEPFPTSDALAELGISTFQRPSDGGNIEWFQYGAKDDSSEIWVIIHGAVSTGGVLEIFPDFDQRMRDLNVRVIAPTMPGWGTSDGYGPLFEITNHKWLENWRKDAMDLVNFLKIDKFWVSGMSLGGPPALALAEAAQSEHRLLGVATLISSMWSHDGFDPIKVANHTPFERFALSILVNPYLGAVAAQLLQFFLLGSSKEDFLASPMVPDDVCWDRETWGLDMQRSVRYQLFGQVQSNRLVALSSPTDAPLIDWSTFTEEIPMYLFYGETDDTVKPVIATFPASKLHWAKRMPFPGGHLDLDIFAVANSLFGSQNKMP